MHPYEVGAEGGDELGEIPKNCDKCGEPLDQDALEEGSYTCSACILKAKRPDICRNCGAEFEDPEDMFCTNCRAPRDMMAVEGAQTCPQCGYQLGINDGKCPECNWHPDEDAIVLANASPMRANAQSAANETRIVPVDVDPDSPAPMITGQE